MAERFFQNLCSEKENTKSPMTFATKLAKVIGLLLLFSCIKACLDVLRRVDCVQRYNWAESIL